MSLSSYFIKSNFDDHDDIQKHKDADKDHVSSAHSKPHVLGPVEEREHKHAVHQEHEEDFIHYFYLDKAHALVGHHVSIPHGVEQSHPKQRNQLQRCVKYEHRAQDYC